MKHFSQITIVLLMAGAGSWLLFCRGATAAPEDPLPQRRLEAEVRGLERLRNQLPTLVDPAAYDLHLFLSGETINALLAGWNGVTLNLTGPPTATLHLTSLKAELRDGLPEVEITAWAESPALSVRVELRTLGVLDVVEEEGQFRLRMRVLAVDSAMLVGGVRASLPAFLAPTPETLTTALPTFSLPLEHTVPLSLPASTEAVRLPTSRGAIRGRVQIPALATTLRLRLLPPVFLQEGIHLFAWVSESGSPPPAPRAVNRSPGEVTQERLTQLHRDVRQRLDTLSALAPLSDTAAGLRADLSLRPILDWVRSLPTQTLTFQSTQQEQQIDGGKFGCGFLGKGRWYVELQHGNSLVAKVQLSNFGASLDRPGEIIVTTRLDFSAQGHLHGHVTPCVGGGSGIDDIPVRATATPTARIRLRLAPAQSDPTQVAWTMAFEEPRSVRVRFKVDLGILGDKSFDNDFRGLLDLPQQGTFPLPLKHEGVLEATPGSPSRHFQLEFQAAALEATARGFTLRARPKILWQDSREKP